MKVETAFKLAEQEENTVSKIMSKARDYYEMNNDRAFDFPYGEVDIQFQRFIEDINPSEREKDLIFISHFFHYAWKVVHVSWFALKEFGNKAESDTTVKVYETLKKYGLEQRLLTNRSFTITEKTFYKMSNK